MGISVYPEPDDEPAVEPLEWPGASRNKSIATRTRQPSQEQPQLPVAGIGGLPQFRDSCARHIANVANLVIFAQPHQRRNVRFACGSGLGDCHNCCDPDSWVIVFEDLSNRLQPRG